MNELEDGLIMLKSLHGGVVDDYCDASHDITSWEDDILKLFAAKNCYFVTVEKINIYREWRVINFQLPNHNKNLKLSVIFLP
ncbi:hypothetical protein Ahy_A09g046246 isoform C [Arachis hypogaea]|uniref:Uncharacterized protein n=1 Tax=Arachis hypogaea TaxID=3818 RepID=A0A445BP90_ARAHY|nr:hypothetical protein Ahy_A09g046246 isoform C [Arachis hypogaea]